MSWLRRLLHLEPEAPEPTGDGKMEAARIDAARELARQQAKLQQAQAAAPTIRHNFDRLGEQVERALRSIR